MGTWHNGEKVFPTIVSMGAISILKSGGTAFAVTAAGAVSMDGDLTLTAGGSIVTTSNGNISLTPNGSGYVICGSGSPGMSSPTSGDLYVSGRIEVDGTCQFDATAAFNGSSAATFGTNKIVFWGVAGSTCAGAIAYTVADDGLKIMAGQNDGTGNNSIVITCQANNAKDHDHDTLQADPTVYFHSATDPDSDNTQYGYFTHDRTMGIIGTGKGDLSLRSATGIVGNRNLTGTAIYKLYWAKATSNADGDVLGSIRFVGSNATPAETIFGQITTEVQTATAASEDGIMRLGVTQAGAVGTEYLRLDATPGVTRPVFSKVPRMDTSLFWNYRQIPAFNANPGASGATFTAPDANTAGGYLIDNAGEVLYFQADVDSDWDGASDLIAKIHFDDPGAAGSAGDTIDLRIVCYYKGTGEAVTKTQTVEVPTTVGTGAQWTHYVATFTIDWDATSNVVEAGDVFTMVLNIETDTSEKDAAIINHVEFMYKTKQFGYEV